MPGLLELAQRVSEQRVLFLYTSPSCEVISCSVFSQEFGLARFKSNQVKAMKGLEYALSNLQGTCTSKTRAKKRGQKTGKQMGLFLTFAATRSEEKQGCCVWGGGEISPHHWLENGVVLFGGGPESERIVLCAVLMQRVIA